ncbi:MAG: hypothetical protein AAFN74_19795 [Myxococcota bacterium]
MAKRIPGCITLIVLSVACSSEDSSPQPSADSGTDAADVGLNTDAAAELDAGPTECDPVSGQGCSGEQRCVWVVSADRPQCRDIGSAQAIGTECDPLLNNCQAGATCIAFAGASTARCFKTCRPGNGDCAGLQGDHVCASLTDTSGEYAFCQAITGCDPLIDACPADEVCSVVAGGALGCAPSGAVQVRGDCTSESCTRGLICLNFGDGSRCYEPCSAMSANPTCNTPNTRCQPIQNRDFGVCTDSTPCDPLSDMCSSNERCALIGGGLTECQASGNVPRGGDCSMMSCQRGNVCVNAGEDGSICYQPCSTNTVCESGRCQMGLIGYSVGICR